VASTFCVVGAVIQECGQAALTGIGTTVKLDRRSLRRFSVVICSDWHSLFNYQNLMVTAYSYQRRARYTVLSDHFRMRRDPGRIHCGMGPGWQAIFRAGPLPSRAPALSFPRPTFLGQFLTKT